MNIVEPLFWDFLLNFVGLFGGFVFAAALTDSIRAPHTLLLRPEGFAELQGYASEERKRRLEEAVASAFRGARILLPIATITFWLAAGSTAALALPNAWWIRLCIPALSLIIGVWLTSALTNRCVRAHLRTGGT